MQSPESISFVAPCTLPRSPAARGFFLAAHVADRRRGQQSLEGAPKLPTRLGVQLGRCQSVFFNIQPAALSGAQRSPAKTTGLHVELGRYRERVAVPKPSASGILRQSIPYFSVLPHRGRRCLSPNSSAAGVVCRPSVPLPHARCPASPRLSSCLVLAFLSFTGGPLHGPV